VVGRMEVAVPMRRTSARLRRAEDTYFQPLPTLGDTLLPVVLGEIADVSG
jgi:hypothetical protein